MVQPRYRSFQHEIPPSRINIRYLKDTGRAQEKVELPLKLLVLGDFTMREDDTLVEERERVQVNANSFDSFLKEQNLELSFMVPNKMSGIEDDEFQVNLKIESLSDFSPDSLVEKVPKLKQMLEVRQLLTDLKSRVITNRKFRLELDKILAKSKDSEENRELRKSLQKQLDQMAPLPEIIQGGDEEP
jgi:type VI secretion system protein ImpB